MSVRPILLAEDNAVARRKYSELLESVGYKVMAAADGEKLLAVMHRVPTPLIILLDIIMPRMDGIETCRTIRRTGGGRPCPILFLTSLDNPKTMLECLEAGGDDFLMKSFPDEKIIERVNLWASRSDAEENAKRRKKAVHELGSMIERSEEERRRLDESDDADSEPTLKKLVTFLSGRMKGFEEDDVIYRFGYLVGLFEAYAPRAIHDESVFHFFFRKLVFKTNFIDPREIDTLLGNYQRLIRQGQFRQGWMHGRDDAALVEDAVRTSRNRATAASQA